LIIYGHIRNTVKERNTTKDYSNLTAPHLVLPLENMIIIIDYDDAIFLLIYLYLNGNNQINY